MMGSDEYAHSPRALLARCAVGGFLGAVLASACLVFPGVALGDDLAEADRLEVVESAGLGFVAAEGVSEAGPIASSCVQESEGGLGIEALSDAEAMATGTLVLSGTQLYGYSYEVLDLVNKERADRGLAPLTMDRELLDAAMTRAAECSFFFDHTRPDGTSCYTASSKMNAENIAAGYASPSEVVRGWMNSSGHRSNILSPSAKSVGIGSLRQSGTVFWVQCFSSQDAESVSCPADVDVTVKSPIDESYLTNENFQFRSLYYWVGINESEQGEARFLNPGWPGRVCELDASTFTWQSADRGVATVDVHGVITGRSGGAAKITASIGSQVSISVDTFVRLAAPSVAVKQEGSAVRVSWGKISGAGSYQVYRGPNPNSVYEQLMGTTDDLFFVDENVAAGQAYCYTVRALYPGNDKGLCASYYADYREIAVKPSTSTSGSEQPSSKVTRLWGADALSTMQSISQSSSAAGSSSTVVVATMDGYWDALTASSVAGLNSCPILLTEPNRLSSQTAAEIKRLGAKRVVISGGTAAVSQAVENQIRSIAGKNSTVRMAGLDAIRTALKTYEQGRGSWGKTAVVATSKSYHDALSASPYSYAKKAPVFLTNPATKQLDADALKAIKSGGFTRVLICGGEDAVPKSVASSLSGLNVVRKGGATAYETSVEIAKWCLTEGMSVDRMGVATATGYWDALAGAAFCGKAGSVLVLADDSNRVAVDALVKPNRNSISHVFAFGGPAALSQATCDAFAAALR